MGHSGDKKINSCNNLLVSFKEICVSVLCLGPTTVTLNERGLGCTLGFIWEKTNCEFIKQAKKKYYRFAKLHFIISL